MNVFGEEERHVALPLTPAEGPFCLFSLRFSSDGVEILGGANDGYLYLFDREARTESLKVHTTLLFSKNICFASRLRKLAGR